MSERRTVRQFSREPVPWELVENAVATARTAPSGAHQQPWTFVVVSDPELKRRMRAAAEEEERRNYESRMSDEWLRALERLGTDWRKAHIEDAPYVIVVFEQAYGLEDGRKVKHYYVKESVGIPGNEGFTWDFVNYTPLTVGGAFVLFGGWYLLSAKKWFKGPIVQGTDEELEAIEREYETPSPATVSPAK
jgi:nitroreductase